MQRHIVERLAVVRIVEAHVIICDIATQGGGELSGIHFARFVHDRKDALARDASGLEELVQSVQTAHRFIKKPRENEKRHQHAEVHLVREHLVRAITGDEDEPRGREQIHRRAVDRPGAHDEQRGAAKFLAHGIEARVLALLARVRLDLADAGDVVVHEGVQRGGGVPLLLVAAVGGERVGEGACGEEGNRRERGERERGALRKHHRHHDHDLQDRDDALLDAVDQHALDTRHVLDEARHDVARRPVVEPPQRQLLDMRIQVAAQIEDHMLLEVVIEKDTERIETLLCNKRRQTCRDEWQ